jgi:hypothetical protein
MDSGYLQSWLQQWIAFGKLDMVIYLTKQSKPG